MSDLLYFKNNDQFETLASKKEKIKFNETTILSLSCSQRINLESGATSQLTKM